MILILAATQLETDLLRKQMLFTESSDHELYRGTTADTGQLCLLHTGIGSSSTAIAVTRFLERNRPQAVLMIGCGGCYPHSGLEIGDLALATEEIFGDLGVMTGERFEPLEEMNITIKPIPVQRISLTTPLQQSVAALLAAETDKQSCQLRCGPFVTVNTCSGNPQLSSELESRTEGYCENMEGAAAAQACALYQVPFLELRGISNPTGTRDPELWDLKRGAQAAQWGLSRILDNWSLLEKTLCSS